MNKLLFITLAFLGLFSCKNKLNNSSINIDDHSVSQPNKIAIKHLQLDLKINFEKKIIDAEVIYTLNKIENTDTLYLDTKQLEIKSIIDFENNNPLEFILGKEEEIHGRSLAVLIKNSSDKIKITYSTSPEAAALQWLNPSQTTDKKFPFLFTQSQAILARSWIPCQDGPSVRFTYEAKVEVPKNLIALMSASNPTSRNDSGIYYFQQTKPIPSYLMALAVGDLHFQSLGEKCGVYAEASMLEKSAAEFIDLPKMITAAESLYGNYQWGKYDVLVLPSSFPFGGMENPELTFATPTIIAGDRSLVSLIAHELAHSWSGNLVTNATWDDFWLNEGFTVYFERRIMEAIEGKEYADMLQVLGTQDLEETLKEFGETSEDTKLKLNLKGRNPDDGLSDIAYEKGCAFLIHIEKVVGREKFDSFLKNYFSAHAFSTITTEEFLFYLNQELIKNDKNLIKQIATNEWIYKPGMPVNHELFSSERLEDVNAILNEWENGKSINKFDTKQWSSHEWLYFIRSLPNQLNKNQTSDLKNNCNFAQSGNTELKAAWFELVIKNNYQEDYSALENFLITVGRRKFLMPLYRELIKTEEGRKFAKSAYKKARPNYHYVSVQSIDELLN